jgi:hypothetical protein
MTTPLREALESLSVVKSCNDQAPARLERGQALRGRLISHARQIDKVLFEGRWLSAEEAYLRYGRLRWQSWLKIVEILLVFFFALFFLMIPVAVLAIFGVIGG